MGRGEWQSVSEGQARSGLARTFAQCAYPVGRQRPEQTEPSSCKHLDLSASPKNVSTTLSWNQRDDSMAVRNWQEHPVVMLGGAFAAGLAFALTIAIPIYSTSQQNTFDDKIKKVEEKYAQDKSAYDTNLKKVEENYERDKSDVKNIRFLREENEFLKKQISENMIELYKLSDKKPFLSGHPVPVGFEAIHNGQPIEILNSIFPATPIAKSGSFYYVSLKRSLIEKLQIDTENGKILDITYYADDSPAGKARLLAAATAAFGTPESISFGRHGEPFHDWTINGRQITVHGSQYSIN